MIFSMVGMHDVGFERLVKAMDEYAKQNPTIKVLQQIGSSTYQPQHCEYFRFSNSVDEYINRADIIVSHGSLCILEALQAGKRVIAVPRQLKFNEVFNDHQIETCRRFSIRFGIPFLLDISELSLTIDKIITHPNPKPHVFSPSPLHHHLSEYFQQLHSELPSD